jgi:mono/diheme cytochrome c family protein
LATTAHLARAAIEGCGMVWRILLGIVILLLVAFGGFYAWTWRSELPPIASVPQFDPAAVKKGAELAAVGNCAVCHTQSGGRPYAGGFPVESPFGAIYATNITPDRDTGIGTWSEDAFRRALREGVGRDGTHFYPAFPYDHFTRTSDADIGALYAFLMTREPVRQQNKSPELIFPLNWRLFASAWQLLFLHEGAYQPNPGQSAEWNRGAYLAESLGHCGACHTPRNALGAEKGGKDQFSGGMGEGWVASALNASSPAPVPWTADQLYAFLRNGFADQHGVAAGPMHPVVHSLRNVSDEDVRAIATYIASKQGPLDKAARDKQTRAALDFARKREAKVLPEAKPVATTGAAPAESKTPASSSNTSQRDGAAIFAGACATCHHEGGRLPVSRPIALGLSSVVNEHDSTNFMHIVLNGIHPPYGERGPLMPGFSGALTDAQIVALANYVRGHYSQKPAWQNVQNALADARKNETPAREAAQ